MLVLLTCIIVVKFQSCPALHILVLPAQAVAPFGCRLSPTESTPTVHSPTKLRRLALSTSILPVATWKSCPLRGHLPWQCCSGKARTGHFVNTSLRSPPSTCQKSQRKWTSAGCWPTSNERPTPEAVLCCTAQQHALTSPLGNPFCPSSIPS